MTVTVGRDTDLGRPMSPKDAERDLGIPRKRVAMWHFRRERTGLLPHGHDRKGDPLFWEVDLIVLSRKLTIWDDYGDRLYTMSDLE